MSVWAGVYPQLDSVSKGGVYPQLDSVSMGRGVSSVRKYR